MIKAAVIGAVSYAGGELLRLLSGHEQVKISHIAAENTGVGEDIKKVFPYLLAYEGFKVEKADDLDHILEDSDVIFTALPHGKAVGVAVKAVAQGKKFIDIAADFRFRDASVYEDWYNVKHDDPQLTASAVYGLPEIYRDKIAQGSVIGNPGCYPTASILSLYPLLRNHLVEPGSIIIDAKSGVSGAGRKPTDNNVFAQCTESIKAYGVATHRHTPEIEQVLSEVDGVSHVINFTPHLIPMSRGILATSYASLKQELSAEQLWQLYKETYAKEAFVYLHDLGTWPQTKWVSGTNFCHIGLTYDKRTGRAVICSAIDNLVKGAAGQAIQNMNILFGLPEGMALSMTPTFP